MKSIGIGLHLRADDVEPVAKAVAVSGLFVSAIEVHEDQPLSDRDLLLRVAGVRAQLLERATFIAVRYGFTFRSQAEAESKVVEHAARWRKTLEENASRVELTLKVASATLQPKVDHKAFQSGADYLHALHAAKNAAVVTDEFKAAVQRHIATLCVSHRWLTRDASSVELAGLMERDRLPALPAAGDALRSQCPDVPFLLSAPWPLEVFADADHE